MMADKTADFDKALEVSKKNLLAYMEKFQNDLERKFPGQTAVLHNQEVAKVLEDYEEAYLYGCKKFGSGNFSLKKIGQKPISMGFMGLVLQDESDETEDEDVVVVLP